MKTKLVTKKSTLAFVRMMLGKDAKWALKALVRIFKENQTEAEKTMELVVEDNGIGFTGQDGQFLSSLAKQFIERGFLSEKQMVFVMKKMPKYARQVINFSDATRLEAMVHEYEYERACESEEARRNEIRAHG